MNEKCRALVTGFIELFDFLEALVINIAAQEPARIIRYIHWEAGWALGQTFEHVDFRRQFG